MLRAVADATGLTSQVTAVLADTYRGPWVHEPGRVFADLACAVADGADCISGIGTIGDRSQHGSVASSTTAWRLVDFRVDAAHLPDIQAARAYAREKAWAAGAAPCSGGWLHIDLDATICIDHSDDKENAAATWKHAFGFHPLLAFLDRPDIAAGEALAGLLRPGNAGSNTAADHVTVLGMALAQLPPAYRPRPEDPDPHRFRWWHPCFRESVPGGGGGLLLRCAGHRAGQTRRGTPGGQQRLVPGDQHRRHHPGRRLGGRGYRTGGPVGLAAGHPADPAEGTTTPRRATDVHRPRRAPGHRVHHRHRPPGHSRSTRRAGTATPTTRPGGGPDPSGEGHGFTELPVPRLSSQHRLA